MDILMDTGITLLIMGAMFITIGIAFKSVKGGKMGIFAIVLALVLMLSQHLMSNVIEKENTEEKTRVVISQDVTQNMLSLFFEDGFKM